MQRDQVASIEWGEETGTRQRETSRRWRLVAPAITPITATDLAAGVAGQIRGQGRDRFRGDVETVLDADGSATYTSFRRALAGCFHELIARDRSSAREVLIPAFCSSDFPDAIEGVGLDPVRYDVDPETLAADMSSLRRALDDDTLAVVAVNVLGYTSRMAALERHCETHGAFLVEALGYALGSTFEGEPLGTFGDCAVLNFQQGKPIPVGGGMVLTQDRHLDVGDDGRPAVSPNVTALAGYAALSRPRPYFAYSVLRDRLEDVVGAVTPTTHPETKFDVEYAPPFATMSGFQGAIARRVFDRLGAAQRQRAHTARAYADAFADCPRVSFPRAVEGLVDHQHVRFPLLAETASLRDRIKAALREAGIQATTLYDWPVLDPEEFPGASALQRSILTLPTHPYVDERDRRTVVRTVRDVATDGD